ncbi:hypothetical protein AB0F17_34565 [Nonomuraea sp. NPDC026600]|uniref:hypothetical protein n=1 Tax=Nonomuraea sp. NPDC026600 TaxID=3155363 RepID=UPI0033C2C8BA
MSGRHRRLRVHQPARDPAQDLDQAAATIERNLRARGAYVTTYASDGQRRALRRAAGFTRGRFAQPVHIRSSDGLLAVWLGPPGLTQPEAAQHVRNTFARLATEARGVRLLQRVRAAPRSPAPTRTCGAHA